MADSVYTKRSLLLRETLVEARKKQGLSQTALAEKLGRLQTFVSKYERGERRLDVVEFLEVADALKLDTYKVLLRIQGSGDKQFKKLTERISKLSMGQFSLLSTILHTFEQPIIAKRFSGSNVVTDEFLIAFGDMLKLHHTLSDDYLDKHRFEAVMERIYLALGGKVNRPSMCNPGHDLTVDGIAWSLKTQGDKSIKKDRIHISKFMELGKGKWVNKKDLLGLRDRFIAHLSAYSRIFQLRYYCMKSTSSSQFSHYYELVEIPIPLLDEARNGVFEMKHKSRQTPKPGYCSIYDDDGKLKFQLYFDGGTERKLQIKNLRKDLCTVHATWEF